MLLIIGIVLMIIGLVFFIIGLKKINLNSSTIKLNEELEQRHEELTKEILKLGEQKVSHLDELEKISEKSIQIVKTIEEQKAEVHFAFEKYCETLDISYLMKEKEYDAQVRVLETKFQAELERQKRDSYNAFENYCDILDKSYCEIERQFDANIDNLKNQFKKHSEELEKIRATYAATKEAKRREEEMELQADFYSLHLSSIDLSTIALIDELKPRLPYARVLCMLIWTTYYQKQMTALCNNVLGPNTICGIYKITNKKSGLCYIGQATDMATRWKQHAKCGLGIDTPSQNKLYKAMLKDGLINFTFELIEECPRAQLNEKEKYYIDLYQSYEYGYNSTSGNK